MTQPRRDVPADGHQVDRVREAMRYHDERLEQDGDTQRDSASDEPPEPGESGGREQPEESGEA